MSDQKAAAHGLQQTKKATASGWIGSVLEYYDFFIYATAASLIFPQIFFPSGNPTVAIVASLATYGVGYVARPIGAFFLGHWGDTHGRKQVLVLCMFLMGLSTMAVGLLPTYDQVGLWAPALLVLMRLVQGFAVAGEISGASSMILEHAPMGRRGYYASFTLQGVQAGQRLLRHLDVGACGMHALIGLHHAENDLLARCHVALLRRLDEGAGLRAKILLRAVQQEVEHAGALPVVIPCLRWWSRGPASARAASRR